MGFRHQCDLILTTMSLEDNMRSRTRLRTKKRKIRPSYSDAVCHFTPDSCLSGLLFFLGNRENYYTSLKSFLFSHLHSLVEEKISCIVTSGKWFNVPREVHCFVKNEHWKSGIPSNTLGHSLPLHKKLLWLCSFLLLRCVSSYWFWGGMA